MYDLASVWAALQAIGVVGILLVCLVAVSRGAYVTRGSHQEVLAAQVNLIGEMSREIARLEQEVMRLESALAARGDD
jgi:AmiR/NasT family two-component response regulator